MNLKFFAKLSLSVSVVFSAGCSTAGFWNVPVEPALPYQVLERYPNPVPEWAKDADKFKRERSNDSVIFEHAHGEQADTREIACSDARAQAVSRLVATVLNQAENNFTSSNISEKSTERQIFVTKEAIKAVKARNEVMASLIGIEEEGLFWEQRDDSKYAGKKGTYFDCMVMIRIPRKQIQQAQTRAEEAMQKARDRQ